MGTYGWGKNYSVKDWLFAEGYRFDFFQAVRLLEMLYSPEKSDDGIELDSSAMSLRASKSSATSHAIIPDSERVEDFVRFKSAVGLNFPTSDISSVKLKSPPGCSDARHRSAPQHASPPADIGGTPITEMTVNLMGLAGALGPLDMPTTELIIERATKNDTGLKDFLDIFNHRLISLLYRIRKMHRIGLEAEPPGQDKISKYLFSIIGLGTDGLKGRMSVRDRSLLHYAGLLSQQPRSMVGLELIISDYFKVKAKGQQFVGRWYALEEEQCTRIGERSGQNQVLGRDAVVLGTHVWDQQAKIEIHLGPLTYQQFLNFIPIGWGYRALCDLTRFYLGDTLDVSFRLILKGEEIPPPMLGMTDEPRLGWTSWLAASDPRLDLTRQGAGVAPPPKEAKDDSQVVLHLSASSAEFKSEKFPLFFNLPPTELADLIRRMEKKRRTYTKFETIMKQDEDGDSMFAIRRGWARATRREENGKEVALPVLSAGECFGEMSLLLGKGREATVVALEECEILELGKSDFNEFAAQNQRWRKTLKAYRYGQFVRHQG